MTDQVLVYNESFDLTQYDDRERFEDYIFEKCKMPDSLTEMNTPYFVEMVNGPKKGSIARIGLERYWYRYRLRMVFDGRKVSPLLDLKHSRLLQGSAYKTVYKHDKNSPIITKDMMGNEVNINSVVTFPDSRHLCLGIVREIAPTGGIYVDLLRHGNEPANDKRFRIADPGRGTLVISRDSWSDILMAKLSE